MGADQALAMIAVGLIFFAFVYAMICGKKPEPKEYEQDYKDSIAIEALRGKIELDALAEREGLDTDTIKAWTQEFLNDADHFIRHRREMNDKIAELELDSKWYQEVCEKYIGSDWKEKTNFDKRSR